MKPLLMERTHIVDGDAVERSLGGLVVLPELLAVSEEVALAFLDVA